MPTEKSARRARPHSPLTLDAVLTAAVDLADRAGVSALSMRKLADHLGVEAMSLYHHVANKGAILDGMVDTVFAEIDLPESDGEWRTAMRERTISARAVLVRHPWAIGLMDSRGNPGPATLRHHDAVIGILRRGGFDIAGAAHAISLIDSYLYGFVLQELNLPFEGPGELEDVAETILDHMPADEFPYLTEMIVDHAMKPGYNYADEFEFGLDLILDGLEALRSKVR
ncbi:AcrR family transcriptional regulator [Rhodococcus sp. WMMA185]|uniref:TetR/AcrR family transcriptional regulator n=1 Tax=Rhodococcus sp. WMMA185 TaxID=679318 RepID=UPI000878CB91|nr:TetR/AcrR family transcriptional regulator [Rhodococcus sp. WMMA185]AOW95038.1 AcrR family transcriptional regulator [Rhodococcus sp. WMMA185]